MGTTSAISSTGIPTLARAAATFSTVWADVPINKAPDAIKPVSYTHLTLPTLLLV